MKTLSNNNQEKELYKSNSNLVSFLVRKDEIKQLCKVESTNKNYISKLINNFKENISSGTKNYWVGISQ